MLLEELTICNVGLFRGEQTLDLRSPDRDRPVILVGGLNGSGKTTLLDSIQLALYGRRARLSNRGGLPYDEYLRRAANREARESDEESFVALTFRRWLNGRAHTFHIKRLWRGAAEQIEERATVLHNGEHDRVLAETWTDFVEEVLPLEIAHLFFFDGEKIEGFADVEQAKLLLGKAVQSLLGLDTVARLGTDLVALERRKLVALKSDAEQAEIERAQQEIERLDAERAELTERRASEQNTADRRAKELREIEALYEKSGGPLFDRRDELEREQRAARERLRKLEDELRECAEGDAPLLLVSALLAEVEEQDGRERRAAESRVMAGVLAERDENVLGWLQADQGISVDLFKTLARYLREDRERREAAGAGVAVYLDLDPEARIDLQRLRGGGLGATRRRLADLLAQAEEAQARVVETERKLASLPAEEFVLNLLARRARAAEARDAAERRLAAIDLEAKRLSETRDAQHRCLVALIERNVEARLAAEDAERIVTYARRVRDTVEEFRRRIIRRHARRIGELVHDSFARLLCKESLVANLEIDHETFALAMRDERNRPVEPERLSAGERQLLAVSMLWGLARASGRPLPVVIDTPLGRLDASHRLNLVERYFPHASRQVILLSTDEEINGDYFQRLKPHIAHTYRLAYDDRTASTHVARGYFW